MRILGLDYGDVRIGVAVSDEMGWTTRGLTTLTRKNPIDHSSCIEKIGQIIKENFVKKIVLGYPRNMDGTEGENCKKVQIFAKQLSKVYPEIEIMLFDERLSTSRALQIFTEQGTSAKKRGQGSVDKMAAQVILQGYLDQKTNQNKIYKENDMDTNFNEELGLGEDDMDMEVIAMTGEDGNEVEYIIIDEFERGGTNFLVLVESDKIDDEESEAVVFKQVEVDGNDDEVAFEEITEEEYDSIEEFLAKRLAEFGIDIE